MLGRNYYAFGLIAIIAFGVGYGARPYISTSGADYVAASFPTEAEANAAVLRKIGKTAPHVALKLGDCSIGGMAPVMCATIVSGTGIGDGPRPIGFGRINGRWETVLW